MKLAREMAIGLGSIRWEDLSVGILVDKKIPQIISVQLLALRQLLLSFPNLHNHA